jgi:hypothetical protein
MSAPLPSPIAISSPTGDLPSINWPNHPCDPYWDEADWLPPWYILERWCQRDEACIQAKQQALLSACERGEIQYRRSDGKTYDDPVHELSSRGKLLIHRQSFNQWCTALEGKTPLAGGLPPVPAAPVPTWAHQYQTCSAPPAAVNSHQAAPAAVDPATPEALLADTVGVQEATPHPLREHAPMWKPTSALLRRSRLTTPA